MNFTTSGKLTILWLAIGIPLLSYFLFQKTFNLALYGDDWIQLYNLWLSFDVHKTMSYFDIRSYIGAYWPQYFFLGIIRYFFGYQDQTYFAASLVLRIFATISLFFISIELSKSRLTAFLATLIFTFSTAGLQTTDWVFNMNTYAGIFFFNLSTVFYLKIRLLKTFFSWKYFAFIILFLLSVGVVPVRMHGAIPFLILTEFSLFLFLEKKGISKIDKFLIARLILPVILTLILIKAGSFGNEGDNLPLFNASFDYLKNRLQKGSFDILFYYLGIIGNIAIPDISNFANSFNRLLPTIITFTLIGLLISFLLNPKRIMYILVIIINILLIVLYRLFVFWNPNLSFSAVFSIFVGLQIVLFSIMICYQTYKTHPNLALSIIISLFFTISFTFIYWPRTSFSILESTSRYMTIGAVGFSILLAAVFSIMIKNYLRAPQSSPSARLIKSVMLIIPSIMLFGWLSINFQSSQLYFRILESNRNLALKSRVWSTLKRNVPELEKNIPSVFYFTYDNPTAAYMVLTFGFWPHAGLVYGITEMENTPLPTDNYTELLEMVKTGEPLKKIHARKQVPVPLSRVFSFDLRNGQLTPTTDLIRQKLAKDLNRNIK